MCCPTSPRRSSCGPRSAWGSRFSPRPPSGSSASVRRRPPRSGDAPSPNRASSCRGRGGMRRPPVWPSSSPSWASTCSETGCVMPSIRGCAGAAGRPMAELLSVRGLRVDFVTDRGSAQVLDGIDLDVGPGEVVGLVGESGCGKTTLARAILGILPSGVARLGGEVRFKGRDLLREDPRRVNDDVRGRAITFIPQDPFTSFSPAFPVRTQIMDLMKWKSPRAGNAAALSPFRRYPRRRYRADREAVLDLLRAVQIPEPARAVRRLPHEFSGGQRQRLLIAMALLPRPDLIVADEPTTALDVTIQAQILRLLRELVKERGVSVLFTTHDLGTAHEICDRIVVMYAGQAMEVAPTDAFFERPAHPYTARLLASVPTAGGEIRDIPGEVPSLISPPSGCRFHPRCDYASAECRATRPAPRALADAHAVACHHPLDA